MVKNMAAELVPYVPNTPLAPHPKWIDYCSSLHNNEFVRIHLGTPEGFRALCAGQFAQFSDKIWCWNNLKVIRPEPAEFNREEDVHIPPTWRVIPTLYSAYDMRRGFSEAGIEPFGAGPNKSYAQCCGMVRDMYGNRFTPKYRCAYTGGVKYLYTPAQGYLGLWFWRTLRNGKDPDFNDLRKFIEAIRELAQSRNVWIQETIRGYSAIV